MPALKDVADPERPAAPAARLDPWRLGLCDPEVLSLRARVWGADHAHTRADFLEWLFGDDNPAGRGAGVVLRRAGRAIGFAGLCPRLARVEGREVVLAHGLDYMVDRSLGAAGSGRHALRIAAEWARLARAEGYAFGINFPNENSRRLLTSGRLGWREVLSPRLMLRPLPGRGGAGSGVAAAAVRLGLAVGGTLIGAASRLRGREPEGAARPLDLSTRADALAVDRLWDRRRDDMAASLRRDAASLGWRYARHPIRRYRLLGWEDGGGLAALLVTTRRELEGFPSVLIVDALFDPGSLAPARALIGAALREAAEGAYLAAAEAVPGTALARALSGTGFLAVPRRLDPKPFVLVGLPLAACPDAVFSGGGFQFAWGDMDVV